MLIAPLVLLWSPTRATSNLVTVLVLIAFAAVGLAALRRQIVAEFPDAIFGEGWSLLGWASEVTSSATSRVRDEPAAATTAETGRVEGLEALAALRDSGEITQAEYESRAARILGEE